MVIYSHLLPVSLWSVFFFLIIQILKPCFISLFILISFLAIIHLLGYHPVLHLHLNVLNLSQVCFTDILIVIFLAIL